MAPLDSGLDGETYRAADGWRDEPLVTLETADTLGQAFRAAREASGRGLDELALITRVPARYLRALEAGDLANLPSRPFALGHTRAYARALGLDEEIAAERLKREFPDPEALQAPVGVAFDDVKRRSPLMLAGAGLVLVAVVGWNVFQRVTAVDEAPPSALAEVPEAWRVGAVPGVVRLDAPRAAPPDQTVPVLYVTPGLEAQLAPETVTDETGGAAPVPSVAAVRAAFNPRGAIYGERAGRSSVILQAREAAAIVVRGGDGVVHFARQLAAGEAYRAPRAPGVVVDVSEPSAFDLYLNGEHAGALQATVTPLSQLNGRAEALARQAAEEVAVRARAAQTARENLQREAADAVSAAAPATLSPAAG